jgi:hypothetical protein
MKVFVVMGNDFPDAAFSTEEAADHYCQQKRDAEREAHERENPGGYFVGRINWRVYEFELDERTENA